MNLTDILQSRIAESEDDDDDDWEAHQAKRDEITSKFVEGFKRHTKGFVHYPRMESFFETWMWGGGHFDDNEEVINNIVSGYLKQVFDYDYEDPTEEGLLKIFKEFGLTRGECEWFLANSG
jgi:hypothetical protein